MQGRGSVTGAYWDDPSLWLVASFIDTFCASLVHRRNSILVRYVYFDHLGPVDISSSIFAVGLVAFDHTKLSPSKSSTRLTVMGYGIRILWLSINGIREIRWIICCQDGNAIIARELTDYFEEKSLSMCCHMVLTRSLGLVIRTLYDVSRRVLLYEALIIESNTNGLLHAKRYSGCGGFV